MRGPPAFFHHPRNSPHLTGNLRSRTRIVFFVVSLITSTAPGLAHAPLGHQALECPRDTQIVRKIWTAECFSPYLRPYLLENLTAPIACEILTIPRSLRSTVPQACCLHCHIAAADTETRAECCIVRWSAANNIAFTLLSDRGFMVFRAADAVQRSAQKRDQARRVSRAWCRKTLLAIRAR
jgi:hypothetical protein